MVWSLILFQTSLLLFYPQPFFFYIYLSLFHKYSPLSFVIFPRSDHAYPAIPLSVVPPLFHSISLLLFWFQGSLQTVYSHLKICRDLGVSDDGEHGIFFSLDLGYLTKYDLFYSMTSFWMNYVSLKKSQRKLNHYKNDIKYRLLEPLENSQGYSKRKVYIY